MSKLILMRHGESVWNKKNLFTGWVDVPLSEKGMKEAIEGGKEIKDIPIDIIYMSTLIRAQTTGFLAMTQHSTKKTLVVQHKEGKLSEGGDIFNEKSEFRFLYEEDTPLKERIHRIATEIYGADDVSYTKTAPKLPK